jgi:hypothetical protein
MKKQAKRLSLSRETLNLLDGNDLTKVNGGIYILPTKAAGCSVGCSDNYCASDSCRYTSCY